MSTDRTGSGLIFTGRSHQSRTPVVLQHLNEVLLSPMEDETRTIFLPFATHFLRTRHCSLTESSGCTLSIPKLRVTFAIRRLPQAFRFFSLMTSNAGRFDGIKAFTGIVTAVIAGDPRILLVDEPEAFLHPALAFKLDLYENSD
jgi:hypothetical protein